MRTLCRDLLPFVDDDQKVTLLGWAHRIYAMGGLSFVMLRDRTGMVQIILESERQNFPVESIIKVQGKVVSSKRAPSGKEILCSHLEVISRPHQALPFSLTRSADNYSLDALLDNRMASLRHPDVQSIFAVESTILQAFSSYLRSQGFCEIKSSKLIQSATEGGSGMFSVQYFDQSLFLAQSPQFYKQAMMASGLERVFECAPAYRREKHETSRHLNEYISLDLEMAYISDFTDLMDLEVALLQAVFSSLLSQNQKDLRQLKASIPDPDSLRRIPRLDYMQAKEIIKKEVPGLLLDIHSEGEKILSQWAQKNYGIEALFVHSYPRRKRPFYTHFDGNVSHSFDLIFRGLEMSTGGQRIHDFPTLEQSIEDFGLSRKSLEDYCLMFAYGCPPHGGLAMGLERLTQKILGLRNVKEASAFPRDRRRTRP